MDGAARGAVFIFEWRPNYDTGGGVKSDVGRKRNQLTKPGDESGDGPCFCKPVVGNLEINGRLAQFGLSGGWKLCFVRGIESKGNRN